jgi:hypothetical protein
MLIRILLFSFIFCVVIITCTNQPLQHNTRNSFRFKLESGTWQITIPEGSIIEDSAAYFARIDTIEEREHESFLRQVKLYVCDSALADTIHRQLKLSIANYLVGGRDFLVRQGYEWNLKWFREHPENNELVDSSLAKITIDGQSFFVEHFRVRRGNDYVVMRNYVGERGEQTFYVSLIYYESDMLGVPLRNALEQSTFRD